MSDLLFGDDPLAMSNEEVGALTRPERESRVRDLMTEARTILHDAIFWNIEGDGRELRAVCVLFSGGNDSTTLAHLFRNEADYFVHANTTIGIEETRDFVRNVSEEWGVPLLERMPPREQDRYRAQVLRDGFPGPAWHGRMYTRLKERALDQVRRELISNPRRERIVFIAGRRRTESQRRSTIPSVERRGSTVWVSPLVNWTKADLNTYRLTQGDVPANRVSDLIHMSGECLCGSFAAPGEHAEIAYWFPEVAEQIAALEAEIADRDDIPNHRKQWGWGADPTKKALDGKASKSGLLCSSCDDRFQMTLEEIA